MIKKCALKKVNVNAQIHQRIKIQAAMKGTTMDALVTEAVESYFREYFPSEDPIKTNNTKEVISMNGYRTFEEARKYARSLGLKSQKEWTEYTKSGKLPDDMPHSTPESTYKNEGWESWNNFLNTKGSQQ